MILDDIDFTFRGQGLGLGRKYREPDMLGALDTEVIQGSPYTLQIKLKDGLREIFYCHGNPRLIRLRLYELLDSLPSHGVGVLGFYFFKYDIQAIFLDKPQYFTGIACLEGEEEDGFGLRGVLTWPTVFLVIRRNGKKLIIIDLFRFFEGGLNKVCHDLKLPVKKLPVPKCIKDQFYPIAPKEVREFERYALGDVDAGLPILEHIRSFWEEYDLAPKISNAHMAATIFLKKYTGGLGLDKPDLLMQRAAIKSYHGGRNSLTVPKLPFFASDVFYMDVSSMYPYCGAYKLPAIFGGRWDWDLGREKKLALSPELLNDNGIYRVHGRIYRGKSGPYKLLMNHEGDYCLPGRVEGVWWTGIEIKTAIGWGILEPEKIVGFQWIPGEDKGHPLKNYFEFFYNLKRQSKGKPALYEFAKKMLNTLYGKMIATIPHQREGGKVFHTPGSLFNAPVASLFTAWSRVYIFENEVKYQSFHAATDSILIPGPTLPPLSKGIMGGWEMECKGDFVVARNKLYAIIDGEQTKGSFTGVEEDGEGNKKWFWEGRSIHKYALHAFQGNVIDLLNACYYGKKKYIARRMGNIRESLRRPDITPLKFNDIPMEVNFVGKYGPEEMPE